MSKSALLGSTRLGVSQVIAGSGTWLAFDRGEDTPVAQSVELVHALFESSSVRGIDTSNNYGRGESERRLGLAIAEYGGLPEGFLLQTKADRDMSTGDFSGARVRRSVAESLDRLGLSRLPLVYLHDPENTTWEVATASGGPITALLELRDEGVIDHVGVAGGPVDLMKRYVETGQFQAVVTHNRYTLVDRSADSLLSLAHDRGLGVMNASPYGGGLLTRYPVNGDWYAYGRPQPGLVTAANEIGRLCAGFDVPLAAAALAWSVRDERVDSTIVGMRGLDDLRATEKLLSVDIPDALRAAIATVELDESTWQDAAG